MSATFVNIRTPRRFADGMQIQLPQSALERVEGFEMRAAFTRPLRQARPGNPSELY